MKFVTRELTGTALLIAYHMAEGCTFQMGAPDGELRQDELTYSDCKYGPWMICPDHNTCLTCSHLEKPVLEHLLTGKGVSKVFRNVGGTWSAHLKYRAPYYSPTYQADIGRDAIDYGSGDDPLTAALRCYITHKLGDEIEIPEELLK